MKWAELDHIQCPKQRYVDWFTGLFPTGQAHGTPRGHASHQQGRWKERLPGEQSEVLKIISRGHLPDCRDKVGGDTADGIDTASEPTRTTLDSTGEHISVGWAVLHHLAVVKYARSDGMCLGESGDIARQALDHRGAESGGPEIEKPATRWDPWSRHVPLL